MASEEQMLKLIWDFKGPEGKRTAAHHAIHLKEYAERGNLQSPEIGTQELNDMHNIAYMVVSRSNMIKVRDELKPHRGQLYEQKE